VRQELQADCYAGIWANGTAKKNLIEAGDIEESMTAAQAIGDDRLQKMAGRRVNPETFTHGSSAQRAKWFRRGYETGSLASCDTFAARDL
jgi:predicted metalloprotease